MIKIESIQEVLTWVQNDQSYMMSFFRIVMSFSSNIGQGILSLIALIPFSFVVLVALWFIFLFTKVKLRYFFHLSLILINFIILSLTLIFAFQSQDIPYGISLMNNAARFTFIISIVGILIDLVLIVLIACDIVELDRTFYYNEKEEVTS